ncbi:DUF1178 family protein [Jannaschia sp. 2305UL9-9]|uniref:DUF1178 family protein n=1 Tax=Jannaschia sp. 2305UL9-9 TaxID=3121638 RepID=UPI00352883F8
MIRYALRCKEGHGFESWFASADAYDTLSARGMVACAVCGGTDVEKALMAPKVQSETQAPRPLSAPPTEVESKIAALRAKVEAEATYVGPRFAKEARAIAEGDMPDRPIWGEANLAEAKALIEDGIPVAPLPFSNKSKAN